MTVFWQKVIAISGIVLGAEATRSGISYHVGGDHRTLVVDTEHNAIFAPVFEEVVSIGVPYEVMVRFTTKRHDLQFTLAYGIRFGNFADVNEVFNFTNPPYSSTFTPVRTGVWKWTPESDYFTAHGHFLFADDGSGIFGLSSAFYIGDADSETSASHSPAPSSAEITSSSAAFVSSPNTDPPITVVPISTSDPSSIPAPSERPSSGNASARSTSAVHSFTGVTFPTFVPAASPPSPMRPHSAASVIGGAVGGSLGGILLLLLIAILRRRKTTIQGRRQTEGLSICNTGKSELGQAPGTQAELDGLGMLTELPSPEDKRFSPFTSHHPAALNELGHHDVEHTAKANHSTANMDTDEGRPEKHIHRAENVYELSS